MDLNRVRGNYKFLLFILPYVALSPFCLRRRSGVYNTALTYKYRKLGKTNDMKFKRGITREVVLLGPYALKFPSVRSWKHFLQGLLSNINEKEWSGFALVLCPVVLSIPGGFLNIMPRIAVIPDHLEDADYDLLFTKSNLGWVENKPNHFGYYKGHLVVVDYG